MVWGGPGTFLPVCSASAQGQGATGSPRASSIQHAVLQAHHGWQHCMRGKIFQFKLSGQNWEQHLVLTMMSPVLPIRFHRITQKTKCYLAACFLGQDQVRKGFLNKTVSSCTNVVLSPFNSIHQSTKGNRATSRCKAKPTSPPLDFLDYNSFL